jgi:pyruvate formate lyase activating enzyme
MGDRGIYMREALFYKRVGDGVECLLCPHRCIIPSGHTGICNERLNTMGRLEPVGYGKVSAIAMDPMEKKPLYHFYPGNNILSVGGVNCNLDCQFCQNWEIAHDTPETVELWPDELVDMALREDAIGIAFTYNEPVIWYEYVLDTMQLSQEQGLKNVLVTNGFINKEPLEMMLPYIDAMNIDVKGYTEEFYRKVCNGSLRYVKNTVALASEGCHVEVTNLVIPGLNDSIEQMMELAKWLADINKNIPLHITRYFPNYKMNMEPTPLDSIQKLYDTAKKYLNYVYMGNIQGRDRNTYCPECNNLLVDRRYDTIILNLEDERCKKCGRKVDIVLK